MARVPGLVLVVVVAQEPEDEVLHLAQGLLGHVGEDEGLVVDLVGILLGDGHEDRAGRVLAELRVERTEDRVVIHHDLVGREGDERAAGHGVVRDEDGHFAGMAEEGHGDLLGGDDEATGRVEDDVEGHVLGRHADGAEDILGVVDVDVAHEGEAEDRHRLLAVNEGDGARAAVALETVEHAKARGLEHLLADHRHEETRQHHEPDHLSEEFHCVSPQRPGTTS